MAGSFNSAVSVSSSLSKLQALNGIFSIYKRQGPTSADVLNALKTALLREAGVTSNPRKRKKQCMKMGHGGTLDSAASGVLVVGVGNGTKMLSEMLAGSKKYVAVAELGRATDTLDATGTVTVEKDFKHITRSDIEEKLKTFTGDIMQVPPLYSALKKDGQRLSVLLKQGHTVEAKPARAVTVYRMTLQDYTPPLFTLDIECGGGFYVRSLVDDLGKALSSCAHVKSLTRTKQGQFTLEDVLHEEHWTMEHVLRVLQPCPGPKHTTACPRTEKTASAQSKTCPTEDKTTYTLSETCPTEDKTTSPHCETCPTEDKTTSVHSETCPAENKTTSVHSETCPTENKTTSVHSETCPTEDKTTSASTEKSIKIQ